MGQVEPNKDMVRLIRLHNEYEKQKKRILALLKEDCKLVGVSNVCENLGESRVYLYKVLNGYSISHEKLMKIYEKVQELKTILRIKGVEDK